jgi:hypothetical protein
MDEDVRVDIDIDLDTVKTWGLILAVGLPVVGVLLALVVKAVVMKVVLLVVFVGLGALVWTQRAAILDYVDTCSGSATFLGVTVTMPQSVDDACEALPG